MNDAPDNATWIKPTLEKMPLESALTGRRPNGPMADAALTYPS